MKNFLLNRENNEKAQQLIELYLNGIEKNAEELLNNPDLPVDSKANLGILIFSKSRITNDDAFYKMIMDISDEPVKRMCLIVGFVCTMDSKNLDFSQWAEVTSIITQLHKENSMDPAINLGVSRYFL